MEKLKRQRINNGVTSLANFRAANGILRHPEMEKAYNNLYPQIVERVKHQVEYAGLLQHKLANKPKPTKGVTTDFSEPPFSW